MKEILLIGLSFIIVGCAINCSGEPPKRAYYHQNSKYGMRYHISLYPPYAKLSHSFRCDEYEYLSIHIYTDDIGTVKGDSAIWKNNDGDDLPFEENGDRQENILLTISKEEVIVKGFKNNRDNGTYKVEKSNPKNWGVAIH